MPQLQKITDTCHQENNSSKLTLSLNSEMIAKQVMTLKSAQHINAIVKNNLFS